jgi:anti-anti-sigma factor
MLDINMEFRKGILFVRLSGIFSANNCNQLDKELGQLIAGDNVRFVTFNIADLNYIDADGINTILKYEIELSKIKGKAIICGVDHDLVKIQVHNSHISSYMYETNDELGAINYINLGGYL